MDALHSYFISSIKHRDIQNMVGFIKLGADINKICVIEGVAPIFMAIDSQNPELVDILCKRGANLNVKNQLYFTPLGYILSLNYFRYRSLDHIKLRMILILLRHGVNLDLQEGSMQEQPSNINRISVLTSRSLLKEMGYSIEKNYIIAKDSPVINNMTNIESIVPFLNLASISIDTICDSEGTSRADTSRADTSRADTSRADTSRADTSRAGTSSADTSRADTSSTVSHNIVID